MGTVAEKLKKLSQTKADIRSAINEMSAGGHCCS